MHGAMCFIHVIIYVLYIQDAGPEIRPAELEADGFAASRARD
jgi:hypothetical protein